MTPSEMPSGPRIGPGRQAIGRIELETAVDLVDEEVGAGLGGDRDERLERRRGRAASRSGCGAR